MTYKHKHTFKLEVRVFKTTLRFKMCACNVTNIYPHTDAYIGGYNRCDGRDDCGDRFDEESCGMLQIENVE